MAINSCTVTGNVKNLLGSNVVGCNVKVTALTPFFHSGLAGTWISGELGETTTDSSGNFSISVIETSTPGQKVKFTLDYYDGVGNRRTKDYVVVVPDSATSALSTLVSEAAPAPASATFPASGVTVTAISGLTATTAQAALAEHQTDIDTLSTRVPAQTASRAVATNASGNLTSSATTSAELAFVSGVTSAIQTQLDAKQASGNYITSLTGDVTASGAGAAAATIAANVVSNAKLAQVATSTFKGRTTASTGNVEDLTVTQATAMLNAVVGDSGSGGTKGLVPAPAAGDAAASKFLKADGTWAATPAGFANPMTTAGDIIYGGASGTATRLAGDTSDANRFLRSISTAGTATAPTWSALVAGDIPDLSASKITTGALATARGGTNLDTSASTGVAKVAAGTWSVATIVNADVSASAAIEGSKITTATGSALGVTRVWAPDQTARYTTVTNANATVTDTDGFDTWLFSTGNTSRTLTLPTAADNDGREIFVKKIDSGTGAVVIDGENAETIDGLATVQIAFQYEVIHLICNGVNWFYVGQHYQSFNNTAPTINGAGTNPSGFVKGVRIGRQVTLTCRVVTGTGSPSTPDFSNGTIPTAFLPDNDYFSWIQLAVATDTQFVATVTSAGGINWQAFFINVTTGNWTSTSWAASTTRNTAISYVKY